MMETLPKYYSMNARPHGIALIIEVGTTKDEDFKGGLMATIFCYLKYSVKPHSVATISEMTALVERLLDECGKADDSFVCCISCSECCSQTDIDGLVDKVKQCSSLQKKPKLLFIQSNQEVSCSKNIGTDMLVTWASPIIINNLHSQFVTAMWKVFKLSAKNTSLISMMSEVSADISCHTIEHKGQSNIIINIENQLQSEVYFLSENEQPGRFFIL